METNVCPHCGKPKFKIAYFSEGIGGYSTFDGRALTITGRVRDWAHAVCDNCKSAGPRVRRVISIKETKAAAITAFCHPAHLTRGMVMVSVEDADLLVERCTSYYCDDKRHIDAVNRLTAAIDAAKGEKA